jgi:hypothetical protein
MVLLFNEAVNFQDFVWSVIDEWMNEYGAPVKWYWQRKDEVLGETCPISTLPVMHPTQNDLGSNLRIQINAL